MFTRVYSGVDKSEEANKLITEFLTLNIELFPSKKANFENY